MARIVARIGWALFIFGGAMYGLGYVGVIATGRLDLSYVYLIVMTVVIYIGIRLVAYLWRKGTN